ncbi:MAG: 23S rRNA (pseudouridine(1915)-N(3))-methyltransferase RlmH [Pseudomonadota bacterium]
MRLHIAAISRIKSGPERTLIDEYLQRANAIGRGIALGPFDETELDARAFNTPAAETEALLQRCGAGAAVFVLDERGKPIGSRALADQLARLRDDGVREAAFLIGGADGHDQAALPPGVRRIAFGAATWPHKLVRVMLAEQLYRAASLLSGSPYHRD